MHQFDLESREINHIQRRSVDGEPELNTQYQCTTGVSKAPGYHPPALMPHHILDHLIVLQGKGDQVHVFTREVQQAHQQSECYCPRSADVMMMYKAPLVARMSNMSQTEESRPHGRYLDISTYQIGTRSDIESSHIHKAPVIRNEIRHDKDGHTLVSRCQIQLVVTHHHGAVKTKLESFDGDEDDDSDQPVLIMKHPPSSEQQYELSVESQVQIHEKQLASDDVEGQIH